ncbi:hypothetical protein [Cysteiniphilum marinum]|nr:hypothetical protein [Cysteiniphilum marinum]
MISMLMSLGVALLLKKDKLEFYVRVKAPMAQYRVEVDLQPFYLGEKFRLRKLIEAEYIPDFIASKMQSYRQSENVAKFSQLIKLLQLKPEKTSQEADNLSDFIVLISGVTILDQAFLNEVLSSFVTYLKERLKNDIDAVKASITMKIGDLGEDLSSQQKIIEQTYQNKVIEVNNDYEENLITWQKKLVFDQSKKQELENQITRIESNINDNEESGYFFLKQNFLYDKLYSLDQEIYNFNFNLQHKKYFLETQLAELSAERKLKLVQLENKYRLEVRNYQELLQSVNQGGVIYFLKAAPNGLSLPIILVLCMIMSLFLALLVAFMVDVVTRVICGNKTK